MAGGCTGAALLRSSAATAEWSAKRAWQDKARLASQNAAGPLHWIDWFRVVGKRGCPTCEPVHPFPDAERNVNTQRTSTAKGISIVDLREAISQDLLDRFVDLYNGNFPDPTEREDPAEWPKDRPVHRRWAVVGGLVFEHYRSSHCGLMTYLVIEADWRRKGVGRALVDRALSILIRAPRMPRKWRSWPGSGPGPPAGRRRRFGKTPWRMRWQGRRQSVRPSQSPGGPPY